MSFLNWVQGTGFFSYIRGSAYAYPVLLSLHLVTLAFFGGMILASFVGIFAIPPLYVTFQAIRERLRPSSRPREVKAHNDGMTDKQRTETAKSH